MYYITNHFITLNVLCHSRSSDVRWCHHEAGKDWSQNQQTQLTLLKCCHLTTFYMTETLTLVTWWTWQTSLQMEGLYSYTKSQMWTNNNEQKISRVCQAIISGLLDVTISIQIQLWQISDFTNVTESLGSLLLSALFLRRTKSLGKPPI